MSQVSAKELAGMLNDDAERIGRYLLGDGGKREGHELRYGSVGGDAGKSLGIRINGDRQGVWCDFATGESGDMLDLWVSSRGIDVGAAIREAKEYLGIRDIPLAGAKPEAKPIPKPEGIKAVGATVATWLRETRKLSDDAVKTYKLVEQNGAVGFPYLMPNGDLVAMKFRVLNADKYWAAADGTKSLFGWQAIPPAARSVVLCEGELKALAWWDYGFPALSLPFGGGDKGKQGWIELEFDNLARFDVIYLAIDEDPAGQAATEMILQRLGAERCAVVRLPLPKGAKCINGCLKAGVSRESVAAAVKAAKPRDPDELRCATDYTDDVAALFEDHGPEIGIRTPWKKIGDDLIFRPSEYTVVAGINGHGKSQAVGFMAASAMQQGYTVCVASLEFKVKAWLKRLCRQIAGFSNPTPQFVRKIMAWLGDSRLWAFDAQGTTDWKRMVEVFRYARRRYGIDLFIIDNLTGLGIGEEDYQGQKLLALTLSNFARDENCHIWLVHHIRKGNSENEQPDKMDIKGSGAITDLASTVLTVWRNKAKEAKKKAADMINAPMDPEELRKPDVRISCSKQRNYSGVGDGEPAIALWWNGDAYHYLSKQDHRPRPMVDLYEREGRQPPPNA